MNSQTKINKEFLFPYLLYGIIFAFVILLFLPLLGPLTPAQATSTFDITLRSSRDSSPIGPYAFETNRKPGSDITEANIAQEHLENKLGKLQPSNTVHIPTTYRQIWLAFTVNNKSDNAKWMINFGNVIDGRLALVNHIKIYNDTTKDTDEYGNGFDGKIFGAAIPLNLQPQKKNLIVMMIEGERGLPLTISPEIISEEEYIRSLLHTNFFSAILYSFFAATCILYLVLISRTGKKEFVLFLLYYAILGIIYTLIDTIFHANTIFAGELIITLYLLSTICGLYSVKFQLQISKIESPNENLIFNVAIIMPLVAALLHFTIMNQSDMGFFLINIGSAISFSILILLFALIGHRDEKPVKLYCIGWTFSILTSLVMCLISLDIMPSNVIILGFYWFLFPIQSSFFAYANIAAARTENDRIEKERVRRLHEEQAISRLQKTRESADQTRLLKVIERERLLMNDLREREVQRTEEMRIAKVIAERANQAKSAFLAVVSHEIRTPMTGILGMIQLIRDTNLTAKQAEYIDTIRQSGDTMMTLLNDILDFEKIEHGSMKIEKVPLDLHHLVKDIISLMNSNAEKKRLYLHADIRDDVPHAVYGDPVRLRQILLNLTGNGIKFTEKGGVTIQVSQIVTDSGTPLIGFSVTDTGIGISSAAQAKLFTPFTQAEESTARNYGGTGLGLSISAKLVEAMGGKIRLISEEAKGSTFSFALAMTEYKGDISGLSAKPEQKYSKTRPLRILVAEDNEINRKVLGGMLAKQGHTPLFATNGLEALEMCKKHLPDLILMDIQMQGMNGIEATKILRSDKNPKVATIPVIALTGNVMAEDITAYFAVNMNGFVGKPIDQDKLNNVIHDASNGKFENPIQRFEEQTETKNIKNALHSLEFDNTPIQAVFEKTPPQETAGDLLGMKVDLGFEETLSQQQSNSPNISTPRPSSIHKSKEQELSEIQKFMLKTIEENNSHQAQNQQNKIEPNTKSTIKETNTDDPLEFKLDPLAPKLEIPQVIQNTEKNIAQNIEEKTKPSIFSSSPINTISENDTKPQQPEKPSIFSKTKQKPNEDAIKLSSDNSKIEEPPNDTKILIDKQMLTSLVDALGKTQFENLLIGFMSKADEIIDTIQQTASAENLRDLALKAHDLKGMAGNFGMIELSRVAAEIEKAIKTNHPQEALEKAKTLPLINEETKIAVKKEQLTQSQS